MALIWFTTVLLFASALGAVSDCQNGSCAAVGPQADGSMLLQAQVLAPDSEKAWAVDPIEEQALHKVAAEAIYKNKVAAEAIHKKKVKALSKNNDKSKLGLSQHMWKAPATFGKKTKTKTGSMSDIDWQTPESSVWDVTKWNHKDTKGAMRLLERSNEDLSHVLGSREKTSHKVAAKPIPKKMAKAPAKSNDKNKLGLKNKHVWKAPATFGKLEAARELP